MSALLRLTPYLREYRRQIIVSGVCALLVATLWGLNLTAAYPVIRTVLEGRTYAEEIDEKLDQSAENLKQLKEASEQVAANTRQGRAIRETIADVESQRQSLVWKRKHIVPWVPDNRFLILSGVLALVFLSTIVKGSLQFVQEYLSWKFTESTIRDVRNDCFRHALSLDYESHTSRGPAELLARFGNDLNLLMVGIVILGGRVIREPLKAIVCLSLALMINWRLTLLSCILLPLIGFAFYHIGRKLKRASHHQMESMSRLYTTVEESFENLKTIQLSGTADEHREAFREDNEDFFHRMMKIAKWDAITGPTTETLGVIAAFLALIPGAYLVLKGTKSIWEVDLAGSPMTIAQLSTLYLLLVGTLDPLRRLSSVYSRVRRASAAAERIFDFLDEQPTVTSAKSAAPLPRHQEQLRLRAVNFSYGPSEPESSAALENIDLTINHGETVLFVGSNGSGKSTLLHLFPRLFDIKGGSILWDGHDLQCGEVPSLRSQVGFVGQNTFLFDDTIRNNILYANPNATESELTEAIRSANIDEFLCRLPNGLETQVGPRGNSLSGGQRQRIALARALAKDPSVLILDEATSAVDSRSAALILDCLRNLAGTRTTLIVSHSLTTELIELATRVVVLQEGNLIADGTHESLASACPVYQTLIGQTSSPKAA